MVEMITPTLFLLQPNENPADATEINPEICENSKKDIFYASFVLFFTLIFYSKLVNRTGQYNKRKINEARGCLLFKSIGQDVATGLDDDDGVFKVG